MLLCITLASHESIPRDNLGHHKTIAKKLALPRLRHRCFVRFNIEHHKKLLTFTAWYAFFEYDVY